MSWLQSKGWSLLHSLGRLPPFRVLIGAIVWALILLLLSAMVGVFSAEINGREVGYAPSLNWSIGFTLVAPLFYMFLLLAYQEVGRLPVRLANANMLRDRDGNPTSSSTQMAARWTAARKNSVSIWITATLLGVLESLWEWWSYSGSVLLAGGSVPESEYDWSVLLIDGSDLDRWLNAGFSLLVFVQQMVLISAIGFLLFLALAVSWLIRDLRKPQRAVRLLPSLTSSDRRCGYELFSEFFRYFLLSGVTLYSHFLLSRLWNVYLRSEGHSGLWSFLRKDLFFGVRHAHETGGLKVGSALVESILSLARDLGALDFSGLFVSVGAAALFFLSLGFLVFVLRRAADDGRHELLEEKPKPKDRQKLEAMVIWPMHYPNLGTLLGLGFVGLVGMAAYRIALFFLGAAALVGIRAAVREAWRER